MLVQLNNDYMERTPFIMQANDRLQQLNAIYGKELVYKTFRDGAMHSILERHIDNLILTFGEEILVDITKIIYGRPAFIRKFKKTA